MTELECLQVIRTGAATYAETSAQYADCWPARGGPTPEGLIWANQLRPEFWPWVAYKP